MTSTRSRPVLFGLLAAVIVAGLWYQLAWSPQSAALASAHRQAEGATQNLFVAEQRVAHLKHLASIASALKALDVRVTGAVPPTDQVDQLIVEVNGAASAAGIAVGGLSFTPVVAATGRLGVQMNVTGGYLAVEQFLDALRDGPRLVVIDSLSFAPGAGTVAGAPVTVAGTPVTVAIAAHAFVATGATR